MKKDMSTKPGFTVLHVNNVEPDLRNRFKGLCAVNGYTLKEGILKLMELCVKEGTLDLKKKS